MRVIVGVLIALAVLCLPMSCISASAQGVAPRTVLIIQEGAENFPGAALTIAALREGLTSRSDVSVEDFVEYLETDVVPVEDAADALEGYIRRKYRSRRIDLVITPTDAGLQFALDRRPKLFADTPIVFSAVNVPDDTVRSLGAGAAGIRIGAAYSETLKLALTLHPSTQHVYVVENVNPAIGRSIRDQFRELTNQATLTFVDEATVPRLLAAISDVPPRSLIFYRYHGQNALGARQYPDDVAALVASAAKVPVYGASDLYIGSGVVGGVVRDTRETGVRLGAIALRILAGTHAQDIPIEDTRVTPILDWRAMQRWGIGESRLPPGSEIRFRGPSLWRDYRRETLAASGVLVLQSFLIMALLYQRRARQRAEGKVAAIIDSSDDAIVAKDLSSTITSWNRGAERIFGYTAQEMIGRSIRTIIPEDRLSEEDEVIRKIRHGEKVSHFETERRRKDGSLVHVSLTISPIYSTAGVVVGASKIARDISDRRRAEVESRRNLALAADANRRVTMTALAGSIAHELGQPLNGILHNAQAGEMLIASQRATPEKLGEILADIRKADLRATQIIERHRAMLRSRRFEAKHVDIHNVVRDSIGLVADSIQSKQIRVDVEFPPDPCFVVGDPVLLQQVVVNLVMNAIDAMTETPPEQRRITVQNQVTSGNAELSVRDAGTGLPASVDGKLFEPFVTTKTNGMGIGLTIAHTIIEAHRGRIAARNNPERGATFTVSLPCVEVSLTS